MRKAYHRTGRVAKTLTVVRNSQRFQSNSLLGETETAWSRFLPLKVVHLAQLLHVIWHGEG